MFCPQNDPLKLKRPNPSESFEMSLRGGGVSGNYTITVSVLKKARFLPDKLRAKFFIYESEKCNFVKNFLNSLEF